MNTHTKLLLIAISAMTLAACGGGGESDGAASNNGGSNGGGSVVTALDTDNDGTPDESDSDDDNDGVADVNDAFPLDASESIDTDGDGTGNNADLDDDNDNVVDTSDVFPLDASEWLDTDEDTVGDNADFYPLSAFCHLETDGNGTACYLEQFSQVDGIMVKSFGTQFSFYDPSTQTFHFYEPKTNHFVTSTKLISTNPLQGYTVDLDLERIYVWFDDGSLQAIDYQGNVLRVFDEAAVFDVKVHDSITYILATEGVRSYDAQFSLLDSAYGYYYSNFSLTIDSQNSAINIYSPSFNSSFYSIEFNSQSGRLFSQTSHNINFYVDNAYTVKHTPELAYFNDGIVFSLSSNRAVANLKESVNYIELIDDNSAMVVTEVAGDTKLSIVSKAFKLLDQKVFDGQYQAFNIDANEIQVLVKRPDYFQVYSHTIDEDVDGDGVLNVDDAFVFDASASVDSDFDGFPDDWNTGADLSNTRLQLDNFPNNSSCSTVNDVTTPCTQTLASESLNEQLIAYGEESVYMLDSTNQRLIEWSPEQNAIINSVYVYNNHEFGVVYVTDMIYQKDHGRLYIMLSNGQIKSYEGNVLVNVATADPSSPRLINDQGPYLFFGNSPSKSIDSEGNLSDDIYTNLDQGRSYVWIEQLNSLFFSTGYDNRYNEIIFNSVLNPIDQNYFRLNANENTDKTSIYLSNDEQALLLGTGSVVDALSKSHISTLNPFDFVAIENSLGDSAQYLLFNIIDGEQYSVSRYNDEFLLLEEQIIDGELVSAGNVGSTAVVFSLNNGNLEKTTITLNDDSDSDGIVNWLDKFPHDEAASVDSDNDGYPDSWNDSYSNDGSSELVIDVFPYQAACYLSEHDDGEGNCDFTATMPAFEPSKVLFSESLNELFLLDKDNLRINRYSVEEQKYKGLFNLNIDDRGNNPHIEISEQHQRLYFSNNGTDVFYYDLNDLSLEPQYFASTAEGIGGIASVGNYLLIQDSSGSWDTHSVFDETGTLTDSKEWNRYSSYYYWNEQNNRVYFFRDSTSPNDLHFEEIDQSTGMIVSSGETPYHTSAGIVGPILSINDGQSIILGSGKVFDPDTLTLKDTQFSQSFTSMLDLPSALVAIDNASEDALQLKIYDPNSYELMTTLDLDYPTLDIFLSGEDVVALQDTGNGYQVQVITFSDEDNDGMPYWWEASNGLSDEDETDALNDDDGDSLNNLNEYLYYSDPLESDTDGDGLLDGEEVNTYSTNPKSLDTDSDGLRDGEEVMLYGTDPLNADSDDDSFSDAKEVLVYETDPLDQASTPQPLDDFNTSFEDGEIHPTFSSADIEGSSSPWTIDDTDASDGTYSLRSGQIDHNQYSSIEFSGLLSAGILSFDYKVDAENCCDTLVIFINGSQVANYSHTNGLWDTVDIEVLSGENVIEFRFDKDGSVDTYQDAVWLDNIIFTKSVD